MLDIRSVYTWKMGLTEYISRQSFLKGIHRVAISCTHEKWIKRGLKKEVQTLAPYHLHKAGPITLEYWIISFGKLQIWLRTCSPNPASEWCGRRLLPKLFNYLKDTSDGVYWPLKGQAFSRTDMYRRWSILFRVQWPFTMLDYQGFSLFYHCLAPHIFKILKSQLSNNT